MKDVSNTLPFRHTSNNPVPCQDAQNLRNYGVGIWALALPGINGCCNTTDINELECITGDLSRIFQVYNINQLPR